MPMYGLALVQVSEIPSLSTPVGLADVTRDPNREFNIAIERYVERGW